MTSPANTIVFCEEVEDTFPETHGQYCGARHFGGSNFVMGDGHVQWIAFKDFCRSANVNGPGGIVCPSPLGQLQWDQSGINGDWKNAVVYHWWPFIGANSAAGG
jgi:prepilin-type processing-associated H-X9-DG protein